MSTYIPADKLIAEIERLLARANRRTDKEHLSHNSEMEKFGEEEYVGVAESPLKTFPRVNDFECGGSYRH